MAYPVENVRKSIEDRNRIERFRIFSDDPFLSHLPFYESIDDVKKEGFLYCGRVFYVNKNGIFNAYMITSMEPLTLEKVELEGEECNLRLEI